MYQAPVLLRTQTPNSPLARGVAVVQFTGVIVPWAKEPLGAVTVMAGARGANVAPIVWLAVTFVNV